MHLSIRMLLLASLVLAGCESRKTADMRARDAYMTGQMQATRQMQSQQPPEVFVRGSVRNPVVAWTDGLTLANAIVTADYTGFMNPVVVRVVRNGLVAVEMKGVDLLHGQDAPLQPGDIVVLQ